ncbi:MAG: hypothetical protein RMK65_11655 [Anaerolineae bacterium]|nr:hypothetical protein [Anaerolineae bacterium]
MAEAQVSMLDPEERRRAVNRMQEILAEDLPVFPLYYTGQRVVVYNARIFDNWYYARESAAACRCPTTSIRVR